MGRWVLAVVAIASACDGGSAQLPPDAHTGDASVGQLGEVPEEPQRDGDPVAGYHALVNRGYVSCGIPYSRPSRFFGAPSALDRTG
jgi:hypothetical protein